MLIINKYILATPLAVAATNDAVVATGITGSRWVGVNPNTATGATGNAAAGDGLVYVSTTTTNISGEVISALVQINFTGTFLVGAVPHFVKVPLSNIGISGTKTIKGITNLGVFNPNAVDPDPSVMSVVAGAVTLSVIKDSIIVEIPDANRLLFLNKILNVLVVYTNY